MILPWWLSTHPLMTKELVFYYKWLSNDVINPSFPLHSLVGILLQGRASLNPLPLPPFPSSLFPFPCPSFLFSLFYIYQGEFVGSFFYSAWYNPLPSLFNAWLSPPSQYLNCSRVGNSGLLELVPVSFWCIILWSLPYFLPKPAVPGSPCIFLVPKLGIVHFPRWPWFLVLGMILKTKICWAHCY